MKLIIGLGNYGKKYELTRHNVGFLCLDYFQKKHNFGDFNLESKFLSEISSGIYKGDKTLLIKPQTYMNLSGEAVIKILQFYKLDPEDILVIYDDISMEFGKVRFRSKGSAGGQNGIKDIIRVLGDEFDRVKIGIGLDQRYDVSNWVLSKFTEEEQIDLEGEVFPKTLEKIEEEV